MEQVFRGTAAGECVASCGFNIAAVTKPSVCHAVATLKEGGFLTMDEDYFLHLTNMGRQVAEKIYERHRFFTEKLIAAGVDPKVAEQDACRIEHVISDESFDCLRNQAADQAES